MVLADAAGAAFRADINLALLALVSGSYGPTEPPTMYVYMPWIDTTTGTIKQRNSTNTAWITKGNITDTWAALAGLSTQVFSAAAAAAAANVLRADQPKFGIANVTGTVAANALTLGLKAGAVLDFRSTTMTTGVPNTRFVPADASLVISSGSTLGTVNAVQSRIVILAIDNAGTVELAAVNLAGAVDLDESRLISTTAEGGAGAADSATTIYSTTARTNVPFRIVGFVDSTQATAGTWATTPSRVTGNGGVMHAGQSQVAVATAQESSTNLSGTAGNFITARINAASANVAYSSVGASSSSVCAHNKTVVTGASCTVDLYLNNTTAYMSTTLTFPEFGTYAVDCFVTASHYSTNYRNALSASAVRVG